MTDTRVLSCHAPYRCRDTGVCCTSGWPIPVEPERADAIDAAVAEGRLPFAPRRAPLLVRPVAPDDPIRLGIDRGACVFREAGPGARCAVHRHLGHEALPLACRQFPRVVVTDARGASITLSHVCPTAASLLSTTAPIAIVANAPAFPPGGEYVGLDVRGALPPALQPTMLMDWPAWWQLEERTVAHLTAGDEPGSALAQLGAVVERVRCWRPDSGRLEDAIHRAFAGASGGSARPLPGIDEVVAAAVSAVPTDLRQVGARALAERSTTPARHVHAALLAAHAFASWTPHLGEGLRTWLRGIESVHVLVTAGVSVGDVDLVLRHLADPRLLAQAWGAVET